MECIEIEVGHARCEFVAVKSRWLGQCLVSIKAMIELWKGLILPPTVALSDGKVSF